MKFLKSMELLKTVTGFLEFNKVVLKLKSLYSASVFIDHVYINFVAFAFIQNKFWVAIYTKIAHCLQLDERFKNEIPFS